MRRGVGCRVARQFIFKPKIIIWVNLEVLAKEDVGTFYDNLVYFTTIWHVLWSFCANLVNFFPFWYVVERKIWQSCLGAIKELHNND
jgi:hypothetical protein